MNAYDIIDIIRDQFEDKEIYFCEKGGIGGTRLNIGPWAASFCHEATLEKQPIEVSHIASLSDFSPEKYYQVVLDLLNKFQNADFGCRKCPHCKKQRYHFQPIRYVIPILSLYCNNKCIYCNSRTSKSDNDVDLFEVIRRFNSDGHLSSDCFFDWGGGEPTKSDYFDRLVRYIASHDFSQRINTNAIDFSSATMEALNCNKTSLRISVDSGTRRGYFRVKGTDSYDRVWKNIAKYQKSGNPNIFIKYNLFNLNSSDAEIDGFVEKCVENGISNVIVDADILSYQQDRNIGPLYYTEIEHRAAHCLFNTLKDRGINVLVSSYAYGVRAEYNAKGELQLPSVYYDNINHATLSNNNFINTYADVEQLLDAIRQNGKPLFLFGAGRVGKMAAEIMERLQISFEFIDNNIRNTVLGHKVYALSELIDAFDSRLSILITAQQYKDILKQINDERVNADIYWLKERDYQEYLCKTVA